MQAGRGLGKAIAPAASADTGYRVNRNYDQQVRFVNGRAFYQNGSIWNDSSSQSKRKLIPRKIAFNSEAYYELIRSNSDAAQWLSLGREVDIVIDDTLYSIR